MANMDHGRLGLQDDNASVVVIFWADIHGPQRIKPMDLGVHLDLPKVSPQG